MQLHFWVPFYLTFALYFVFLLFPLCLQCSPMLCFSDSWYNFCFLYDPFLLRVNKTAHDLATVVSYYPCYCSFTLGWIVPVPLIEFLKNCQLSRTFFIGACFPKDLTYQFWVHWTLPCWRSLVVFSLSFWDVGVFFHILHFVFFHSLPTVCDLYISWSCSWVTFHLPVLSQFVLLLRIKAGRSHFLIQVAYLNISSNASSWTAHQPFSSQLTPPPGLEISAWF